MTDPRNFEQTFEQARRRQCDPLPADFTDSVMQRVAAGRNTADRSPGFWPMAAAAVLTAAAIGLVSSPREERPQPPKLALFGGNATHSPFVNP